MSQKSLIYTMLFSRGYSTDQIERYAEPIDRLIASDWELDRIARWVDRAIASSAVANKSWEQIQEEAD